MIRFSLRPRIEIGFGARVSSLVSALALAAAASVAAPTPAFATLSTWVMAGSATFTNPNGTNHQTDTFGGSFVFDDSLFGPGEDPYSAVDIAVAGPLAPGIYTSASGDALSIRFPAEPPAPAFLFSWDVGLDNPNVNFHRPSGGDFIAGPGQIFPSEDLPPIVIQRIPEPASLTLLGGALALLPLTRRLSRRGRSA